MKDKTAGKSQTLFVFLSITISLALSFTVAEWVLAYQRQSIELSDRMDPGMIVYDALKGWGLKPYWSGRHDHYDYSVAYSINRDGFRGIDRSGKGNIYSIVGDSFSFGLGVNDDETFSALLNRKSNDDFYNYSVPGYSTDQQLLLINKLKDEISHNIFLIVYLGNDIFDNMRSYPLQAEHGKPYFILAGDTLSLENTPVPLAAKPAAARKESISSIVLADYDYSDDLSSWLAGFEVSRRLGLFQKNVSLSDEVMHSRFEDSLRLFYKLLGEIQAITDKYDGQLNIVLLPGRSYVEQPASISAQYQEFFRQNILNTLNENSIAVKDLAAHLRVLHDSGVRGLYYPYEGHLTAEGHQYVADYLFEQIHSH